MRVEGVITVFLKNGGEYLLMKRADNRRYYPGAWSGIGGHVEGLEMFEPEKACLREIWEESGISADKISGMKLRYVWVGPREDHITVHYVYFGETSETRITDTDEGTLYWVPEGEVLSKDYTPHMRLAIEHYFSRAVNDGNIYLFNENDCAMLILKEGIYDD